SLDRKVAVINWRTWPMQVTLPDLGENFSITQLNINNGVQVRSSGKSFSISPGTYLMVKEGTTPTVTANSKWKNIMLNEYTAPQTTVTAAQVLHTPIVEVRQGNALTVNAVVVTKEPATSVKLYIFSGIRTIVIDMEHKEGYTYQTDIPKEIVKEGFLTYYIAVEEKENVTTFPSGDTGLPTDWHFRINNA